MEPLGSQLLSPISTFYVNLLCYMILIKTSAVYVSINFLFIHMGGTYW